MQYKHVHIVGSGALGSVLAAQAVNKGYPVVNRPRNTPVRQVTLLDKRQVELTLPQHHWPEDNSPQLVVLPLKSYQIEAALTQYEAHFCTNTQVLLVHNGMLDWSQSALDQKPYQLYAASTSIAAFKPSPTTAVQTGEGETFIGTLQSQAEPASLEYLNTVCNDLFGDSSISIDIRRTQWQKLTINSLINPLTAIHGFRNGELLNPRWQPQLQLVANELSILACKQGFDESPASILGRAQQVMQRTAENFSSMQQDVALGRPTEIDAINGYALSIAKHAGIECPQLTEHYHAVKALG
ncbi:2-dehydropantoate 2-reductase [Alteromonas sp. ASW11-36]|uniref:2-dehydropantoate 2-reductase n=1 Tax=Alteromonas arenosi TaxID=3055817 RepID=A0ABT7SVK4_9ALTE|nr:2-dehydropantoate 2-reductase [Alteromonas sp. ASW11-36]MDM7860044.1 2-dehydropantoate 2-reductase [Alteromonas sp. ASW11-36]